MAAWGGNPEVSNARPTWKNGLDQCRVDICNNLHPLEVMTSLQARGVISQPMIDTIKGYPIRYDQNYALVTWLQTGAEESFEVFCEILIGTNQSHIGANIRSKISAIEAMQSIAENVGDINDSFDLPRSIDKMTVSSTSRISEDELAKHPKGFIVVTGGRGIEGPTKMCFAYDIASNGWDGGRYIPNMTRNIYFHALLEYDGRLWIIGGSRKHKKLIWEQQIDVLSASDKTWQSRPIVSNSTKFGLIGAAILQNNIYAVGVCKHKKRKDRFSILVMEKDFVWREVSKRKSENSDLCHGFAALNNKIYFCGSHDEPDSGLEYNLSTNSWCKMVSTNHSDWGFKTVVLHGCIVVIGGSESGICEKYDPAKDKWENLTTLPKIVYCPAVATDGDWIFVIGGCLGNDAKKCTNSLQIYDYEKNEWKIGANYPIESVAAGAAFVSPELVTA